MKKLIIYATRTGYVTECVEKLAGMLSGDVDTINLAGRPPAIATKFGLKNLSLGSTTLPFSLSPFKTTEPTL